MFFKKLSSNILYVPNILNETWQDNFKDYLFWKGKINNYAVVNFLQLKYNGYYN